MEDLAMLQSIIQHSEKMKPWHQLNQFISTRNIGLINQIELDEYIRKIKHDSILHPPAKKSEEDEFVFIELERKLINHIGTVFLFMEYTRRLSKKMESEKKGIINYQNRVDNDFKKNGCIQFVHKLRNYFIHNDVINLIIKTEFSTSNGENKYILIDTKDLVLDHDNWNSESLKYITECGNEINVENAINEYNRIQKDFFEWFISEYKKNYKEDLEYSQKIIDEWNVKVSLIYSGLGIK